MCVWPQLWEKLKDAAEVYNFLYSRTIPGWNAPLPRAEVNTALEAYPPRIALGEAKKLYLRVRGAGANP